MKSLFAFFKKKEPVAPGSRSESVKPDPLQPTAVLIKEEGRQQESSSSETQEQAPTPLPELLVSEADVTAAYKIFLRRLPEGSAQVQSRVGLPADRILFDFLACDEFTSRPEAAKLILVSAQKMIELNRLATSESEPSPSPK